MIRFLFRFVGLWLLAGAFIAFVYDGTKTIAGSNVFVTKLEETWNALHPTSLQALHPAVDKIAPPWLWERGVVPVLQAPTWLVLGISGSILILLGRKKKPPIGYGRD